MAMVLCLTLTTGCNLYPGLSFASCGDAASIGGVSQQICTDGETNYLLLRNKSGQARRLTLTATSGRTYLIHPWLTLDVPPGTAAKVPLHSKKTPTFYFLSQWSVPLGEPCARPMHLVSVKTNKTLVTIQRCKTALLMENDSTVPLLFVTVRSDICLNHLAFSKHGRATFVLAPGRTVATKCKLNPRRSIKHVPLAALSEKKVEELLRQIPHDQLAKLAQVGFLDAEMHLYSTDPTTLGSPDHLSACLSDAFLAARLLHQVPPLTTEVGRKLKGGTSLLFLDALQNAPKCWGECSPDLNQIDAMLPAGISCGGVSAILSASRRALATGSAP